MALVKKLHKMDSNSKSDSFIERRKLFKNIWETAMKIEEKDDVMIKPKIIKTLRLNEIAKQVMVKTKKHKQRIRNLRHVCNKILDFCDKQDADDLFYEQMEAKELESGLAQFKIDAKSPKKRKGKRKIRRKRRARSTFASNNDKQAKVTVSDRKDKLSRGDNAKINTSNKTSPNQIKKTASDKTKAQIKKTASDKTKAQIKKTSSDKTKVQIKKSMPKPKKPEGVKSDSTRATKSSDASAVIKRKVLKKKRVSST